MNEWRYEIKHGPEGEANYAWLYKGGEMVATMKTHHAVTLSSAQSTIAERDARIAELERQVDDHANWASSMQDGLDRGKELLAEATTRAEAAEALLKEAKTEIERVLLFGGRMANACYNISRKLEVSSLDKRDLHFAQLEWDAETKPVRSLASKIGGGE